MRMWMANPKCMCKKYLNTEHYELHILFGSIKKNPNNNTIKTLTERGYIEPKSIYDRHEELVKELLKRNIKHNSPMDYNEFKEAFNKLSQEVKKGIIDKKKSSLILFKKCNECEKEK